MSRKVVDLIESQMKSISHLSSDVSGAGAIEFTGNFHFNGTWSGYFKGEGADAAVTFLSRASFQGEIVAREVFVYGRLEDVSIRAEIVRVYRGAYVSGRIVSASVQLEEGAIFKGRMMPQAIAPTE
ncbi:MAG TPA: polymer-forming cytoskeletal protein [Bdellovibrionota bacterium]|jgi:cytoskeletal protein CcmA (bactofilin family)|nr:polymer-forming cytoskeletal protein [Bdellovibrionota bacterium]